MAVSILMKALRNAQEIDSTSLQETALPRYCRRNCRTSVDSSS